ncbi:pyrethroid hydrolase Ces2e-like [Branchiostoma lanceolatum]|uniref:pyrethroid hydrolase Ces2e-like n=1 Tax=Branchiostoma lanceolatum TaxID=7740 RepID=UPI0034560F15
MSFLVWSRRLARHTVGSGYERHTGSHRRFKLLLVEVLQHDKMSLIASLSVVSVVLSLCVNAQDAYPTRTTSLGRVSGITVAFDGTTVEEYLGVPYAAPPTGPLRFKPPKAAQPWQGVRNVSTFGNSCMQTRTRYGPVSEDCLFLNIYVPFNGSDATQSMAVMVYIHGGRFNYDTALSFNGKWLAARGDVIVVTLNYRLNVFGFLSTGDRNSPGNYGLMDQRAAIVWVKDNIGNFGGDPDRITIFGESAGGMAVSMQLISPKTTGLFQRAICQSGVAMTPGAINYSPLAAARKLCEYLGCGTDDPAGMVSALMDMDPDDLTQAAAVFTGNFTRRVWLPVIDGDFLPEEPARYLEAAPLDGRQLLIGCNNDEGGAQVEDGSPASHIVDRQSFEYYLNSSLFPTYPKNTQMIMKAATYEYGVWEETDPEVLRRAFAQMYGDFEYLANTVQKANLYSRRNHPTYMYLFTHRPSFSVLPEYVEASHGQELYFLFPDLRGNDPDSLSAEEEDLSRTMIKYWTNFAKTGNPMLPSSSDLPTDWPQYVPRFGQPTTKQYLSLKTNMTGDDISSNLRPKKIYFWTEVAPALESILQSTCEPGVSASPAVLPRDAAWRVCAIALALCFIR